MPIFALLAASSLLVAQSSTAPVEMSTPTARDQAVLQGLLTSLIYDKEMNPNHFKEILLCKHSPGDKGTFSPEPLQVQVCGYRLPPTAVADFNTRNGLKIRGVQGKRFDFSQLRFPAGVVLTSYSGAELGGWIIDGVARQERHEPWERIAGDRYQYYEAWAPGFSRDGKVAVISGWYGPVLGLATLDAVLRKQDGAWVVAWRDLDFRISV